MMNISDNYRIAKDIATEGLVLLKNSDNVLPLQEKTIALFGAGAVETVFCGTGSGYVSAENYVNVLEGLEKAGITIASKSWLERFLAASKKANDEDKTLSDIDRFWSGKKILIDEIPVTDDDILESKDATTAIYVIRRNAGEDNDRTESKGDYYLTDIEEANLRKVAGNFANTVVVLNTCVIDANFIESISGIKAAILMGPSGCAGGEALAQVLIGKSFPSGKLTSTWAVNYKDNPASSTFAYNDGNPYQEDYAEDIFIGYRYFDTFGVKPLFPFGYGLSYTTFDISAKSFKADWNQVSLDVEVKNTGKYSGKEVVQLYVTAPEGRLTKPFQELKAYKKTDILAPGETQIVTLKFSTESLTAFDEKQAAFIMEPGEYLIRVGNSSANTKVVKKIILDNEAIVKQVRNEFNMDRKLDLLVAPVSSKRYDDHQVEFTNLFAADCKIIDGACKTTEADEINKKRFANVVPAKNATFFDVVNNKASMDEFVASLEPEVLVRLVTGVANETPYETENRLHKSLTPVDGPVSSGSTTSLFTSTLGIPNWKVTDGPAGLHLPGLPVTCFPTDIVIAQTWNDEMAYLAGDGIGMELLTYNQSVILGPGMNIHRDPLCGRNFEYFSEDPLISGKMAAAITKGVQSNAGASVSIKHFACNNQESERFDSNATVSERALREIYLRGFEICVREANPHTVMTSYNMINGIHTSSNYQLLTDVLRGEWGFKGLVMTDWGTHSEKPYDYHAGNDLVMGGYWTDDLIAAMEGKAPEFSNDGYVVVKEFPIYGGFATEIVERWNAFKLCKDGKDIFTTKVEKDVALNPKVMEKVDAGTAKIETLDDGTRFVSYCGINRGAYLDIDDVRACAANVLKQIINSVSYIRFTEKRNN
jgi:beta-glucosidase